MAQKVVMMEEKAVEVIRRSQSSRQVKVWRVVEVDELGQQHKMLTVNHLDAELLAQSILTVPYTTAVESWIETLCIAHGWSRVDDWARCAQCVEEGLE